MSALDVSRVGATWTTYVTFSDKPLMAREPNTNVLAGDTSDGVALKALLVEMFKVWEREMGKDRPLIKLA